MFYGKERNKCKTRSYFVLFNGVLRFGTDLRECFPIAPATEIEDTTSEGSRSKTDATLHLTLPTQDIWLLPPQNEKDSWVSVINLTAKKYPYTGHEGGPFPPLPSGLVKVGEHATSTAKVSTITKQTINKFNIVDSSGTVPNEDFDKKKHTFKGTLSKKRYK